MTGLKKKNIVIFSALYMPHLGGVEKYSQSIAGELSSDYQVTVFCMNTEHQPVHRYEGTVSVYFLPCIDLFKGRFPIPLIHSYRAVRDFFAKTQVDFAIVQCRFYLMSPWACHFLAAHKVPFIQMEHGAGPLSLGNPWVDPLWHFYENSLTWYEKKYSKRFYGVSQASVRWLKHFGIEGRGVLANSIAPGDFKQALACTERWRRTIGIPDQTVMIVFSGRIMVEKGILDVLEAFDEIARADVHLVVAGGGSMELVARWQERPNIHFLGQVQFDQIPYILKDADIFCLPSHFIEGQPTAMLEAGYCGTSVIASANGGIPEVITDGENGLLVPSGDVNALRQALQRLIDDPTERIRLGTALHHTIEERYTWKVVAEHIKKIMNHSDPDE